MYSRILSRQNIADEIVFFLSSCLTEVAEIIRITLIAQFCLHRCFVKVINFTIKPLFQDCSRFCHFTADYGNDCYNTLPSTKKSLLIEKRLHATYCRSTQSLTQITISKLCPRSSAFIENSEIVCHT